MRAHLLAALVAAGVSPAFAGSVNIVDGDTLSINGERIRIVDIDTPETFRSRCENELVLGLKAKERLRSLVDSGTVTFEATGTDRYRRTLARVFVTRGAEDDRRRQDADGRRLRPALPVWRRSKAGAPSDLVWSRRPARLLNAHQ